MQMTDLTVKSKLNSYMGVPPNSTVGDELSAFTPRATHFQRGCGVTPIGTTMWRFYPSRKKQIGN